MLNSATFIVHLERATSRVPQVKWLLRNLPQPSRVISGIDGACMSAQQIEHYARNLLSPKYPFALRQAEIATFLSHRKCWQAIIDDELDAALIVEDDVSVDLDVFLVGLKAAFARLQQGDIIRFPVKPREHAAVPASEDTTPKIIRPNLIGLGMQMQLVSRDAARTLLDKTTSFDRPVDTYLQMQWCHRDCRIYSVWPSGVSEVSDEVGGSLISERKTMKNVIYREIMRRSYRRKVKAQICSEADGEKGA